MGAPVASPSARDAVGRDTEQRPRALAVEAGRILAKKYVLERPAGFGGMAQLWVATNQATGAEVCVKLLLPDPESGGHDEEAVQRFRREAQAAARLSHRAIVRVFDLIELDANGEAIRPGTGSVPHAYAIVMELLRGETLGDMLARRSKLPLEEAVDLFLPIVSALGHAHRADVIHRDLKPDNIFLAAEPDGHVIPKILDFGVSKLVSSSALTVDGVLVGTPSFMSPEQAKGARDIDARSDVFSAGILLYMMLSGRNPFDDAPTFAAVVDAVLRRPVRPLEDVPAPIWAVIDRAISKDPSQRFDGATEMANALRKAAGRRPATESDPMIPVPAASLRRPTSSSSGTRPKASIPASSPALDHPASGPVDVVTSSDAARRRRMMIVAGVLGIAAALVVAAALMTLLGSKTVPEDGRPKSQPSAVSATPEPTASVVEAPAPAAKAYDLPPAPSEPTAPATSGTFAKTTAAPARPPAAPRRAPAGVTPSSVRKPGQEPNKARDPGF